VPEENPVIAELTRRVSEEPFLLISTLILAFAITHAFFTRFFHRYAVRKRLLHERKIENGKARADSVSPFAEAAAFLGEVEVVFALWTIPLAWLMIGYRGWDGFVQYIAYDREYNETLFTVVIMLIASTRPVLKFAEITLWKLAKFFGGTLSVWWFLLLTVGPLLGSLVTEPAAMTIVAHLLAGKFYDLEPSRKLRYATIALLFVHISIGGTMTNFAALPVIMVTIPWDLSIGDMFVHFGYKSALSVFISTGVYYLLFRKEFGSLQENYATHSLEKSISGRYLDFLKVEKNLRRIELEAGKSAHFLDTIEMGFRKMNSEVKRKLIRDSLEDDIEPMILEKVVDQTLEVMKEKELKREFPVLMGGRVARRECDPDWNNRDDRVPAWVMVVHLVFLAWTVFVSHIPVLFVAGFLFLMGFIHLTPLYQNRLNLRQPVMVGFFLGSLIVHGGLQGWWLEPVIGSLDRFSLMVGSAVLTSFNDNAAIAYLGTQIPHFTDPMRYALLAGAVTGGGLTVIANAPNPVAFSVLKRYFRNNLSMVGLFGWAVLPTLVAGILLMFLPG